jgi:hypothetical protein
MFESPESANLWFDIFNGVLLTGAFLVAVGTWGTIKTASVKERFSDERVSANELETKRAIADSDAAKEGTAKANEAIAKANVQIAGANEVAAKANERAAALEKEAAQARVEQERLKSQMAWRRLSKEQFDIIAASVRGVNLDAPLDIATPVGDVEAGTYAAEILRAFKAGGLAVPDAASAAIYAPLPPTGVIVVQPGTAQIGHPIAVALANARIQVSVELNAPALKLIIGSKPSQF